MLTSDPTISAECWASLLHGVTPEYHRLTNAIVSYVPYDTELRYPSIFKLVRQKYPDAELASLCNWKAINGGIIENGLDIYTDSSEDADLTNNIIKYLGEHDPKLLFVDLGEVDSSGHKNGLRHRRASQIDYNIRCSYR